MLIAGVGGQGINSLAKVLALTCREAGWECQYTVHKGGAQSLGSVYAEMRIVAGPLPVVGPSIPVGKLDVLVAMDPWEALRHMRLAHTKTVCYVESEIMPLFTDRTASAVVKEPGEDPRQQLKGLPIEVFWRQYRQDAIAVDNTAHMANYFAGLDCLPALGLSNTDDYQRIFFTIISKANRGVLL